MKNYIMDKQLILLFLIGYTLLTVRALKDQDNCKILALQGGATKGVYEDGVIYSYFHSQFYDNYHYDFISGISTGSLNTLGLSTRPKGEEKEASELMKDLWLKVNYSNIFKWWPGGIIGGLLFKPGLIDSTPLKELLKATFDLSGGHVQREVIISATNADFNRFDPFYSEINDNTIVSIAMASSSIPGAFPPTVMNYYNYVDGGIMYNVNYETPIYLCEKKGYPDEKIIVDIVMTTPCNIEIMNASKLYSYEMFQRASDLQAITKKKYALHDRELIYKNITFRNVVIPKKQLPVVIFGLIPFSVDHAKLNETFWIGVNDGIEALNNQSFPKC